MTLILSLTLTLHRPFSIIHYPPSAIHRPLFSGHSCYLGADRSEVLVEFSRHICTDSAVGSKFNSGSKSMVSYNYNQ
jgi:hypothetical protein